MTGTRQMFYARLPEVKGSAGGVAFAIDEVLRATPAHRWTLNHTRLRPSGSPGDPDIFGSQQYAPLLDLEVPG